MLRIFFGILILTSCSFGNIKSGGDKTYTYDVKREYTSQEMKELSPNIVTTLLREPPTEKLQTIFGPNQAPIKKIGIVIFESQIQPTRDGLSGRNQIYLSDQGKQLLTEKYLTIWEESINVLGSDLSYVSTSRVKKRPAFHKYGSNVEDHIKSKRTSFAPDDIFFLESGKTATSATILNPRGMRDMSFVLVPAYELMNGPKWSEHNKHFLNDVSKELGLDALIIVMNEVSWTVAHTDKHSGEYFPEHIKMKIKASTLIPLHLYHARLDKIRNKERPGVTICYRAYQSELNIPISINLPEESKTFNSIESELLSPMLKSYKDLTQMTIQRMFEDLKKTW